MMPLRWILHFILFFFFLVKVTQLCPTLCNPMDYIVRGTLQARILEWVAFPFSRGSFQPRSPTLQGILYQLSHQRSPRILEWVAYPFSRVLNRGLLHCRWILYQQSYYLIGRTDLHYYHCQVLHRAKDLFSWFLCWFSCASPVFITPALSFSNVFGALIPKFVWESRIALTLFLCFCFPCPSTS